MASDKPTAEEKKDPIKQDSEESPLGSSLDGDGDGDGEPAESGEQSGNLANPTPEQAPKRKGGRKPVCCGALFTPTLSPPYSFHRVL